MRGVEPQRVVQPRSLSALAQTVRHLCRRALGWRNCRSRDFRARAHAPRSEVGARDVQRRGDESHRASSRARGRFGTRSAAGRKRKSRVATAARRRLHTLARSTGLALV